MTDTNPATATQSVTIQSTEFVIPAPYAEGATLNANEASAMNQLYAENVRNNCAGKIKAARAAAEEAGVEFSLDAARDGQETTLRQELQAYADSYKFGARVARSVEPVDPVQKEAHRIASDILTGKLAEAKVKRKDLEDGVWDQSVKTIAESAQVQSLAAKRVKDREKLAVEDFDIGSLAVKSNESEAEGTEG